MKQIRWFFPFLVLSYQVTAQNLGKSEPETSDKKPFVLGETVTFYSNILQEKRSIHVYLPPGYAPDSLKTYPIIYLLDGSADEDFIHIVGIAQFATFPWVNTLPESIVIGISNVDRRRDYTYPTHNEEDLKNNPTSGKSALFIDFMEKELMPFVDREYKVNGVRTLIGQSLGGLLATEILYKKPDLFSNYIIVSPSLWWDNESLLAQVPVKYNLPKKIYLTVGELEMPVMVRTARALAQVLGADPSLKLFFREFRGANHANILHLAVYEAFEKLWGK